MSSILWEFRLVLLGQQLSEYYLPIIRTYTESHIADTGVTERKLCVPLCNLVLRFILSK